MACESDSRKIGEHSYTVTQMPATRALELESRIVPVLFEVLAPVFEAVYGGPQAEVDLQSAFSAFRRALPPEEYVALIKGLCEEAMIDGKRRVDFDEDFSGGAGVRDRYLLAWFVLEVNYADFLGSVLPSGAMELAQERFLRTVQPESSTGESGPPS